jgi:hypothetical protein
MLADWQTDRHDEAFRNFTSAPERLQFAYTAHTVYVPSSLSSIFKTARIKQTAAEITGTL